MRLRGHTVTPEFTPPRERVENAAMWLAQTVARAHAKGWLVDPPPEVVAAITAFREASERVSHREAEVTP